MGYYRWFKNSREIVMTRDKEREKIISSITKEYYDDYISNKESHTGDLKLCDPNITSLGNLKSVDGRLSLEGSGIKDLGNLGWVGRNLDLRLSNITDLGNLRWVGEYLDIEGTDIPTLGKLEYVGRDLDLQYTNLIDLGKLGYVSGRIHCTKGTTTHKLLLDSEFEFKVYEDIKILP